MPEESEKKKFKVVLTFDFILEVEDVTEIMDKILSELGQGLKNLNTETFNMNTHDIDA